MIHRSAQNLKSIYSKRNDTGSCEPPYKENMKKNRNVLMVHYTWLCEYYDTTKTLITLIGNGVYN